MTAIVSETPPPKTMQAACFYTPGDVRFETTPTPSLKAGELLVKVETALTCGTDVKCFRRGHPVLLSQLPSPFGHEFAGTVVAVGSGVERFKTGDRVVAANSAPCGNCFYCAAEQENLCENLSLLNGAYAEYIRLPQNIVAQNTYLIPAHFPAARAAFAEPLAVCLRGVEMSLTLSTVKSPRICVMGLGPIGQLLVRVAKECGAHVTALGRSEFKRTMAAEFGQADTVLFAESPEDYARIKQEHTEGGRGFDVVIEAIGQPHTWEQAVQLSRKGGVINLFAGCPGGSSITLDTRTLHYNELTVISLFHHTPAFFKKAVEWLLSDKIDPSPLLSLEMPLSQTVEALQLMEAGRALKIALYP